MLMPSCGRMHGRFRNRALVGFTSFSLPRIALCGGPRLYWKHDKSLDGSEMTPIVLERSGKIATVTLDIPPVNTLSLDRYQMITDTFMAIGSTPGVNCVVLTARGTRAFCAGLDLQEFLAA